MKSQSQLLIIKNPITASCFGWY